MKRPFAPLGCAIMAHIKPKNRQFWDVHADTGFNIRMAMEHHQCFHIYIVKTRATRISDTVFFKHQYITSPKVTPKTLFIKAASDLTSALKRTISHDGKTAGALQKFSKLYKDNRDNIRIGNGKRATEQPLKSLQCPPSCTTSKGG
jgi:hypothetical protein